MIFFVEKMKKASHIFSTKNIGIFQINTFEILTLTNNFVRFEQLGPDFYLVLEGKSKKYDISFVVDCIDLYLMKKVLLS